VETITSSDASGWVLTVCSPIHRTSAAASAIDPLLDDPAEDRLALAWQVSDAVAGRHSRRALARPAAHDQNFHQGFAGAFRAWSRCGTSSQ
jgi:hypothetical protein